MRTQTMTSVAIAALAAVSTAAVAQDETGDVIVVTAQKREQNIQEVPLFRDGALR